MVLYRVIGFLVFFLDDSFRESKKDITMHIHTYTACTIRSNLISLWLLHDMHFPQEINLQAEIIAEETGS